jgi:hypothetical protein
MNATIYINEERRYVIRLSKDRKTRNAQIKQICKDLENMHAVCYVDIKGGDIKQ